MKYIFFILLCWVVGFMLPVLTTTLQWIVGLLVVGVLVAIVCYYIATRITAIRV